MGGGELPLAPACHRVQPAYAAPSPAAHDQGLRLSTVPALVAIAGALSIGVVSPGPSFVMVARTAVAQSRADGLAAAVGMGVGGVTYAIAALFGLRVLLAAVPAIYVAIKLLGGAYLVWLGIRLWIGAKRPLPESVEIVATGGTGRAFWLGLATQLSNPKTAVVYGSVFAAFVPREVPGWLLFVLPGVVFVIETAWYGVVALALSSARPRAAYLRSKAWIDRAAGTAMTMLGLNLVGDFRGA